MKKKLISAILGFLFLASCSDKDKGPQKVTSITITPNNVTLTAGQSQTFTATVLPDGATDKNVKWSTSDDTKATVNEAGAVTAVAEGKVTLTATAEDGSNVKGTADISITGNEAGATAFKLGAENFIVKIPAGETAATLNNAPRTIAGDLTKVPVTIAVTVPDATVKIGSDNFTNGSNLDLTKPVTFTVSRDGTAAKNYSLTITAYQAESNPYGVYTPKHLNDMRNGTDMNYKLMNSVTMPNPEAGADTDVSDYAAAGWLPIAHEITIDNNTSEITSGGFRGTFDGNKNIIDNLYIRRSSPFLGLFGVLTKTAIIRNLTVKGRAPVSIDAESGEEDDLTIGLLAGFVDDGAVVSDCTVLGDIAGKSGTVVMGGIAGRLEGQVTNCTSSVNVVFHSTRTICMAGGLLGNAASPATVSNCTSTGKVTGKGVNTVWIGGLIGLNSAPISDCSAKGDVSGEGNIWLGGLVGSHSSGAVSNCFAEGNVNGKCEAKSESCDAGGLAGYVVTSAAFTKCYATGNVTAESAGQARGASAAGLIGNADRSTVNNCYATGNVQALAPSTGMIVAAAGGLLASSSGGTVSNCYTSGEVNITSGEYGWAGGIVSREYEYEPVKTTFTNNYRSSGIKKNNTALEAGDASIKGIAAKTKAEMRSDIFTGLLNGTGSVWGREDTKNNKLPYIIGVGVGK